MAKPDRTKKSQVLGAMVESWDCAPATHTMSQANASTTMVRTAVATVESVCRMPHLARMEVTPAKSAEPKA